MPSWTDDQKKAITSRGGKIIVSAAAGSGKTAVLSQRVITYVTDGGNIDDLLIVTFTNAAAQEMKERIKSIDVTKYVLSPVKILNQLPENIKMLNNIEESKASYFIKLPGQYVYNEFLEKFSEEELIRIENMINKLETRPSY